jgi:Domain of unknown function (DUF4149)
VLNRISMLLVAAWSGLVLTLATVAAPVAFATLERSVAGALVGQYFRIEAHAGLALAAVLFLIERRRSAVRARDGQVRGVSVPLLLVLGALFCTVLGYFALQPLMAQARAGQGSWSFGALHAASSGLFALKGVLLLVLLWRHGSTA